MISHTGSLLEPESAQSTQAKPASSEQLWAIPLLRAMTRYLKVSIEAKSAHLRL